MRSQTPAMFDWPVRLCSLTDHGKPPLGARHVADSSSRVFFHASSPFPLAAQEVDDVEPKRWTRWSEANQNSITWTSFHVSSVKTSMKVEIFSLNLVIHRS